MTPLQHPAFISKFTHDTADVVVEVLDESTTAWAVVAGILRFPFKVARFVYSVSADGDSETELPSDRDVEMTIGVYAVAVAAVCTLAVGRVAGLAELVS